MGCTTGRPEESHLNEMVNENIQFRSKFEKLMYNLKKLKEKASKLEDKSSVDDIDWVIGAIQDGNLYDPEIQMLDATTDRSTSNIKEAMDILHQYSNLQQAQRLENDTAQYHIVSLTRVKKPIKYAGFINKFKRSVSNIITTLEKKSNFVVKDIPAETLRLLAMQLTKIESFEFNVFEIDHLIEKKTLYFALNQIFLKYGFFKDTVNENTFLNFITEIIEGYDRKVVYHNDLHATDVLQTTFIQIEKGNLMKKLKLTYIDVLATLIAATCHDYKHNGFNNIFHMNVQSDIAICYNDSAVLENFHVSETFKVILKIKTNIFDGMSPEEYRIVRRRMIDGILATDMATHSKNIQSLKSKLDSLDIKGGINVEKLIVLDNHVKNYENSQMVLSQCIHTSDLSNPAKIPEVFDRWTEYVFKEFFIQGDMEKSKGLMPSMLCDRNTTKIYKSQVGFIRFVVIPQFETMLNIMPEISPYMDGIQLNLKRYEALAREEED